MSDTVPTIRVKSGDSYAIINESDFDEAVHERWFDPLDHDANGQKGGAVKTDGPTVAEFVARGYQAANYPPAGYASRSTPEEIAAAIAEQAKPAVVEIPADWADLHHNKQIALAKALHGADLPAVEAETTTETARKIIADHVAQRAAAAQANAQ